MNDLAVESQTSPRTQRFLRELTGAANIAAAHSPRDAIDELMRRARIERSLEIRRLLIDLIGKLRPAIAQTVPGRPVPKGNAVATLSFAACSLIFVLGLAFVAAEVPGVHGAIGCAAAPTGTGAGDAADAPMCAP